MDFLRNHQILGYHPLGILSNFFSAAKGSFREPRPRAPPSWLSFQKKGGKGKEGEAGLFLDTPFDWAKIKKTVRFPFADEKKTF
jgi:hypothetical protein